MARKLSENYLKLKPGAEYIELKGCAVPIAGLKGERRGQCFYPENWSNGYLVRVRQLTLKEKQAAQHQAMSTHSADMAGAIFQDWK